MPRTVILPGGRVIKDVPDDVSDDELEKMVKESEEKAREEAEKDRQEREERVRPGPQEVEEPKDEGPGPTPHREQSEGAQYINNVATGLPFRGDNTERPPLAGVIKNTGETIKGIGEEVGKVVRGGFIEPLANAVVGMRTLGKSDDEKAKARAMAAVTLDTMFGRPTDVEEPTFQINPETKRIDTEDPETFVGKIAPYVVTGPSLYGAVKAGTKAPGLIRNAAALFGTGQIQEQALTNPYDATIFDVLDEFMNKDQKNEMLNYLAAEENDSEAERRLKLVFQDATLVGAISSIPVGAKFLSWASSPIFSKLNKSVTNTITDSEASEALVRLVKMVKRKPRQTIANPGVRKPVEEGIETVGGVAQVTRQALPEDAGPMQKVAHNLRRFYQQSLTSRGYNTESGFKLYTESVASQRAIMERAENIASRLSGMMKSIAADAGSEKVIKNVSIAMSESSQKLRAKAMRALPTAIRAEVREARKLVDSLSKEILDSPQITQELREVIEGNVGSYLNRSYKAFTDPKYVPSDEVFEEAQAELAERIVKSKSADYIDIKEYDEAFEQAKHALNDMLGRNGVKEFAGFSQKLIKVNKGILKKKNEKISPAMRALLGEVTDPSVQLVNTVQKMSELVYKSRWFDSMEQLGKDKFLFSAPRGIYNTPVTGTNSLLDFTKGGDKLPSGKFTKKGGYYTTPEMARVLNGSQASTEKYIGGQFFKTYGLLKGFSQKAKTIYSHPTHMKNTIGGFLFRSANGYAPFSQHSRKAFATVHDNIVRGGDKELHKAYEEFLDLGIINTNTRIAEFRQLIDNAANNPNAITQRIVDAADDISFEKGSLWSKVPDKIYMGTDDYFKINTYLDYKDTLRKAFPDASEESLKRQAADVTRNIIPNYDLVPNAVKELRKLPFGNFAGFNAEVLRTSYNIVKLSYREITSGNQELAERGLKRLFGLGATAGGGVTAAASVSQRLAGLDTEEKRKAFTEGMEREFSPNPTAFARIGDDGVLYGLDMSSINPYTYLVKPVETIIHEIIEGKVSEDAIDEILIKGIATAGKDFLSPYIGESIATEPFLNLIRNKGPSGDLFQGKVTLGDEGADIVQMFYESLEPGTLTALRRANEAFSEAPQDPTGEPRNKTAELEANLSGARWTPVNSNEIATFGAIGYMSARRKLERVNVDFTSTPSSIMKTFRQLNQESYDIQAELHKKVSSAIELGLNTVKALQILQEGGLSKDESYMIFLGKYKPPTNVRNTIMDTFDKVYTEKRKDKEYYDMGWADLYRTMAQESARMTGVSLRNLGNEENPNREQALRILKQGR